MKTCNTKKILLLLIVFMIMGNQFTSAQNEILTENKLVVPGKHWVFQIYAGRIQQVNWSHQLKTKKPV